MMHSTYCTLIARHGRPCTVLVQLSDSHGKWVGLTVASAVVPAELIEEVLEVGIIWQLPCVLYSAQCRSRIRI